MKTNQLVLPCLRGVIGDWVYYSSLMTAKQIRNHIKAAKDIRESKTLDEYLQRDLKDRRKEIAKYLLTKDSRFFNSIVIGVFDGVPDWYEFEIKQQKGFKFTDQDFKNIQDSVGFLVFNGDEDMFAIDGQHRVAGIAIAEEEDEKEKAGTRF